MNGRLGSGRRILLVNQFYPPDHAPTGIYLEGLARHLAAMGHQVDVLAGRVAYDGDAVFASQGRVRGVRIQRIWTPRLGRLRLLARLGGYLCFLIGVWSRILAGRRPDVVVSLTTPPFLGWVVALAARTRGIPHAHWVMDAWPDALVADGILPAQSWILARLSHLARRHLGGAAAVIAIGEAMAVRLRRYRRRAVAVLPLWATTTATAGPSVAALRTRLGWPEHAVVFGYSGNLGRGHRWRDFAAQAAQASAAQRWVFIGGGVRQREMQAWCTQQQVSGIAFLPYLPAAELPTLLAAIDVHLVSVERGWEGVVVPSKVQNIAAAGRPLLVVAPMAAEPARWVAAAAAGWVVAPDDEAGLMRAVAAADDARQRHQRGVAAGRLAAQRFAPETALGQLAAIIIGAASGQGGNDGSRLRMGQR